MTINDLYQVYVKRQYIKRPDGSYPVWQVIFSYSYFKCWWYNAVTREIKHICKQLQDDREVHP